MDGSERDMDGHEKNWTETKKNIGGNFPAPLFSPSFPFLSMLCPQLPEMLRVSLDDMVLQILLLDKGDPAEFLASAVNPPTELAVANSIKYLCELQVRFSWFSFRDVAMFLF